MDEAIRVLHVDDEVDFLDLASAVLDREPVDLEVVSVTDAGDGLDLLDDERFDCVLSDYEMPGMNGIDFLQAVRKRDATLPFILFTGRGSEEVAAEAITAGATDYLQKETGTGQFTVLANRIENAVAQFRARRASERADRRRRETLERITDGFVAMDDELVTTDVNDQTLEFTGLDREALIGRPYADIVDPGTDDCAGEVYEEVLRTGTPKSVERRSDINPGRWVEERIFPEEDGGLYVYFRDITESKAHEERLRELERYNRQLVETAPVGLLRLDEEMRIAYENPRARAILGVPDDSSEPAAIGLDPRDLPSVQAADQVEAFDRIEDGETVAFELWFESIYGRRAYLSGTGVPLFDAGTFAGAIIMLQDDTDRKEREDELETMRNRLEVILENTTNPIFMKDRDGRYVFVNRGYRELFGLEDGEAVGRTDHEIHGPTVADAVRANDRTVLETGRAVEREETVVVDGERRVFRSTKVPVYEGRGEGSAEPVAVLGVSSDITDLERRQTALRRERDRLDEFASIVSHDLRGPLSVATGRLELAMEECESDHLDHVSASLSRMGTLVDDLLSLAREGKEVSEMEPVELAGLIEDCARTVDLEEATLVVETDGTVMADRSRLQQLLENLLHNAIDHVGPDVTVTVGELPEGFYVGDDGPGIPEDRRERVFELDHSSHGARGGLGLTIVRAIAQAHGWKVDLAESRTGGARFEFTGVERA